MTVNKPSIVDIEENDVLRTSSRQRINSNIKALKASIDALIDLVSALGAGSQLRIDLYNDGYSTRAPESEVANGLYFRIGPVPPGDNLTRDTYIKTVD